VWRGLGHKEIFGREVWFGREVNARFAQTCFIPRSGHVGHMDFTIPKLRRRIYCLESSLNGFRHLFPDIELIIESNPGGDNNLKTS
jgi:hypothetical protein